MFTSFERVSGKFEKDCLATLSPLMGSRGEGPRPGSPAVIGGTAKAFYRIKALSLRGLERKLGFKNLRRGP